jgi:hypothetical protein
VCAFGALQNERGNEGSAELWLELQRALLLLYYSQCQQSEPGEEVVHSMLDKVQSMLAHVGPDVLAQVGPGA